MKLGINIPCGRSVVPNLCNQARLKIRYQHRYLPFINEKERDGLLSAALFNIFDGLNYEAV